MPAAAFATPRILAENLLLIFGFIHPNHALVTGGWSIGVEVVFYAAFPLLAWFGRRGWIWMGAMALALFAWSWHQNMVVVPGTVWWDRFHAYVQVRNHAFLFLLGGLLVELRRRIPQRLPFWGGLAMGLLLLLAMLFWRPHFDTHLEMMMGSTRYGLAALMALLVGLAAFTQMGAAPGRRGLLGLGDMSYGLYLIHPLAFHWTLEALRGLGLVRDAWALGFGMGSTLLLAWLSHRYLERPLMALGAEQDMRKTRA